MRTTFELNGTHGVFTAFIDEEKAGIMQIELREPNTMDITHTITTPGFEGKGVGKTLVKAGIKYAQAHNLSINPICSFAKAYIEKISGGNT